MGEIPMRVDEFGGEHFDLGKLPTGTDELVMSGPHLVKHYLQQAQLHAEFLPGGTHHGLVVQDHVITPEEAAEGVRQDLANAMQAIEELAE